ncbi:amidohydrolase family protein, partial [Ensifer aridi]|uniref:amidohydrolase family protein n=1 Tax=Ensifer aridi TaxID=1708715 RepID=UPI00111C113C
MPTRRSFLGAASSLALPALFSPASAADPQSTGDASMTPDLILHRGLITTLDRANPAASAVAIKDGRFLAVGDDRTIMGLAGPGTKVVDLKGKRVLPGLNDNHTHVVRGGLNYNMELRWDGVRSLADAMDMLKRQVAVTPPPQWVRVVGG